MRRQLSILAQHDVFDFFFSLSPVFFLVAAGSALAYYREGWDKALEIEVNCWGAGSGTEGHIWVYVWQSASSNAV